MPPIPHPGRARRRLAAATALAVGLVPLSAFGPAASAVAASTHDDSRVAVIIEFAGGSAIESIDSARLHQARDADGASISSDVASAYSAEVDRIESQQRAFVAQAATAGVVIDAPRYLAGVLDAVAGTVAADDVAGLRALPGVARVSLDERTEALTDVGVPTIGGQEVWAQTAPDGLQARGAGVTVAILDTGIDYTLADLGGGFGEGYKVVDGWDVVNDDADPMDDHFHGTHVAGIVAGTGASQITGVAPDATLTAYKVLDAEGGGRISYAIEALERAVSPAGAHPADVINMSLGFGADGTDPLGRAADNAAYAGAVVVAAAGNAGPDEQTIGSPAAADAVLAVGASATNIRIPSFSLVAPEQMDLPTSRVLYSANPPKEGVTARVVDVGTGSDAEFEAAGDLSGAIVVYSGTVPRGTNEIGYDFYQARLAEQKGAIGALVYEIPPTDPGQGGGGPQSLPEAAALGIADGTLDARASGTDALGSGDDLRFDTIVVMGTKANEYAKIRDAVLAGGATATIGSTDMTDTIASFSSRGPSDRMRLKPEIVAPGVDIRSTVPAAQGVVDDAYRLSGTSMAAPHVAGAAALVRQMNPGLDQEQVRQTLIGSAAELKSSAATASPSEQGAGRLDVAAAVAQSVTSSPATASLGLFDADAESPDLGSILSFVNSTSTDLTATFEVVPSKDSVGTATIDVASATLAPQTSQFVTLIASPDASVAHGEVSGVVIAHISDGSEVRVPYLAVSRDLLVRASPDPSSGHAKILVHSDVVLDAPPTVEVTTPSGAVIPVPMSLTGEFDEDGQNTRPGWYDGSVDTGEVGEHGIRASGEAIGATQLGSGSFERVAPLGVDGTWQQLGRDNQSSLVATSPAGPDTAMLVSNTSSRPFFTADHGVTWSQVRDLPVGDGGGVPIADPEDPNAFWYLINGTVGSFVYDGTYDGAVLRTDDLGVTWSLTSYPDEHIYASASSDTTLAIATDDGVEYSHDGGSTWSHISQSWGALPTDAVIAGDDLVVQTPYGLWRIAGIDDPDAAPGTPTKVQSGDVDRVFTMLASSGDTVVGTLFGGELVRSTDAGATWTSGTYPAVNPTALDFVGDRLLLASTDGYYSSTDGGRSFDSDVVPYPFYGPVAIDFDRWSGDDDSLLVSLENAGLYSTTDDEEFTRLGVSASTVTTILPGVDENGEPVIRITDEQGIGRAAVPDDAVLDSDVTEWGRTQGEGWIGRGVSNLLPVADDDQAFWRIRQDSFSGARIERSADGGLGFGEVGPSGFSSRGLAIDPHDSQTLAAGFWDERDQGILVTHTGWDDWATFSHPISITQLTADPAVSGRLWIAAEEGLYVSDDFGATIRQLSSTPAESVWVDAAHPSTVLVGGAGILTSTDGGQTFTEATTSSSGIQVSSFTSVDRAGGTVLFAGTETHRPLGLVSLGRGVLMSVDSGSTWSNVSDGLTATSVKSLAVTANGSWLLAGTGGGGVYRASVAVLAGEVAPPTTEPTTPPTAEPTAPPTEPTASPTEPGQPGAPGDGTGGDSGDDSADGPLASTGFDLGSSGWLALLAIALGVTLVVARRRARVSRR